MKILVLVEQFTDEARKLLEAAGHTVESASPIREDGATFASDADAMLVRLGLPINRGVLDRMTNLKAVATATTGLNHIDLEAAQEKKIEIISLKGDTEFLDTITSTSELAFGMLIDLMRKTPWAFDSVRRGEFLLEEFRGRCLFKKTLGIVGLGRLGKIVAQGAAGWRMAVLFADPHVSQERFPQYTKVELDSLLSSSDAVSLH